MDQARRINRVNHPFIVVTLRTSLALSTVTLWREDHFETTAGDIVQRYKVLDFGVEERSGPVLEEAVEPQPGQARFRPKLGDDGQPLVEWVPTGNVQVEMQRVDEKGRGMSLPVTKLIPPVDPGSIDTGWHGWRHVADSPRRPVQDRSVLPEPQVPPPGEDIGEEPVVTFLAGMIRYDFPDRTTIIDPGGRDVDEVLAELPELAADTVTFGQWPPSEPE